MGKWQFRYPAAQDAFICCKDCPDRQIGCRTSCERHAAEEIAHVIRRGQYIKDKNASVDIESVEKIRKKIQMKQKK